MVLGCFRHGLLMFAVPRILPGFHSASSGLLHWLLWWPQTNSCASQLEGA